MVEPSVAAPQRQPAIVLPPSVVPTRGVVPVCIGTKVKVLVVLVKVLILFSSAIIIMLPFEEITKLLVLSLVKELQEFFITFEIFDDEYDCTFSVIELRQEEATNNSSETLALVT